MTTLAEVYLHGNDGSTTEFIANLSAGQRIGQAFFNALSVEDQQKLTGTSHDPFYVVHGPVLHHVIEFLIDGKCDTHG